MYQVLPGYKQIPRTWGANHFHRGSPGNIGISPTGRQQRLTESPEQVKYDTHVYAGLSQDYGVTLTGLPTGQIGYSRTGLLIQRIHQNAPLLHISGRSPVDMLIYTLHQELRQFTFSTWNIPIHNYYTDFTYTLAGLHKEIHINTIYLLLHIRPLPSRTQHRLPR